ncbi:MAG: hypothetical protein IH946_02105, partial [Bacteroidetes bacterium]|nr:hypothetical protein [Bacteroidota bacterium]
MKTKSIFTITIMVSILLIYFYQGTSQPGRSVGTCDAPLLGAAHSGAPGEVNCTGCHSGTINSGPGTLSFSLSTNGDKYVPGETYTATIVLLETGIDKFGFQVTFLEDSGETSTGTIVITDSLNTRYIPDVGRNYVGNT